MKRFTQKFFLLAIGMILSVGASAQSSDGIAHRYPEFTFTATVSVKGTNETFTFTMPAWDAYVSTEIEGNGKGYRMQLIENPTSTSGKWRARIVGSRAFSNEKSTVTGDYWFASFESKTNIVITKPDGSILETNTSDVTYGDIFGPDTPEPGAHPFSINKTTSTTGDLVIQKERKIQGGKWLNYTFKIVEIADAAFRNNSPSGQNVNAVTGTVTIPNTIEKIGHNAFRHGAFKKVVFEEGSQVTTIERATFEGCRYLEEVVLPASIETIKGTAFGSCEKLQKIVFEGNVPTFTNEEEEPLYKRTATGNVLMPEGGYNFYQGAKRLQSGYDGTVGKDLKPERCIVEVPLHSAKSYMEAYPLFEDSPMSSPFPLTTSSGMMTYCSDLDFTFKQYNTAYTGEDDRWTDGSMKVYYVTEDNVLLAEESGVLTLSEITGNKMVPGWQLGEGNDFGVVLKGAANETYSIFYPNGYMTDKESMNGTGNCLHGVIEQTLIDVEAEGNENNGFFILSGGKFHRVTSNGNCKAYRAYIKVADGGYDPSFPVNPQALSISFPGEATGITALEVQGIQNDVFYTLQGVQVKNPQKGVFIKNGKKYIIK